jgi:hypothetical protein
MEDLQASHTFKTEYLSEGVEGQVLLAQFRRPKHFKTNAILKNVHLRSIKKSKQISEYVLKASVEQIYELFLSTEAFRRPSLTEIVSQTFLNQLVFQKLCPHFCINYYWEFDSKVKTLKTYNEYIDGGDFDSWAQEEHSEEEWLNAFFQIFYALSAMKRYFNMYHCDFHSQNILVQKVKPGGYWTYKVNDIKYYVPNLGYIFIINDFGFSYIPGRLQIDWLYEQRLQFINNMDFYDIYTLMRSLKGEQYKIPPLFKQVIQETFNMELTLMFNKKYYKQKYQDIIEKDPNAKRKLKLQLQILEKETPQTQVQDKLYQIYSTNISNYTQRPSGKKIESYSLDITFDLAKLPKNFRHLVQV